MKKKRVYMSIYYEDALAHKRRKRDLTLAFVGNDALYKRCKKLGSAGIKRVIGISSYRELVKKAREEDRPLSNYIKYMLKKKIKG